MKEGYIEVKCRGCGSGYEMPNIGVIPVMKDCPVCKQVKKGIDDILKEIDDILKEIDDILKEIGV